MLNRYFNHIACLFACTSVVFYLVFMPVQGVDSVLWAYTIQELFVRYGFLLIFLLSFFMKPLRTGDFRIFAGLIIYLIISSLFLGFDINQRRTILNIGLAFAFYKTIVEFFDVTKLKIFAYWMAGLVILNLVFMAFQANGVVPLFTHVVKMNTYSFDEIVTGFLKLKANVGVFGSIAGITLALINPLMALVALPFIWLGQTSASLGGFILSFLLILYFRMKKIYWVFLVVLILSAGAYYVIKFDMPLGQFQERFKVWDTTLVTVLKINPILGTGIGRFASFGFETMQGPGLGNLRWNWAHNEYLQFFFETGVFGFFFLVLFLKKQFEDFWSYKKDKEVQVLFGSFLTIAITSVFHFPFHVGKFAGLCVFILALYQAKIEDLKCLL